MLRIDDWLAAGLVILAREGEPGLRIDRMARELGVTKGSFHHHFRGIRGFRRALLAHHEDEQQRLLATARELTASLTTESALQALPALVAEHLDLSRERALRAWAVGDADAAATVERIDTARLDLLTEIWGRTLPPDRAGTAALVPHLALVGAITTGRSDRELQRVFTLLTVTAGAVVSEAGKHGGPAPQA